MTTYSLTRADGSSVSYVDRKRQLWIAALAMPLIPLAGIVLYVVTGSELAFLAPLVFFYLIIPLADVFVGDDENNPPEELVPQLEQDNYYRHLIWATIPVYFATLVAAGWVVGTQGLSTWAIVAVALGVGQLSGTAITIGHELGHKKSPIDRLLARIVFGRARVRALPDRAQPGASHPSRNAGRSGELAHGREHLPFRLS